MTYQSAWLSVMEPPDIDMGLTSGDIVARWVRGRGYTIANSYVNTSGDIVASWAPMRVRGGILDLRGHCCQVVSSQAGTMRDFHTSKLVSSGFELDSFNWQRSMLLTTLFGGLL